jgi:hypothetical protein
MVYPRQDLEVGEFSPECLLLGFAETPFVCSKLEITWFSS